MELMNRYIIIPIILLMFFAVLPGEGQAHEHTKGDFCLEHWTCTEWSGCIDGYMTRVCTDESDCRTNQYKPCEEIPCFSGWPPPGTCTENWTYSEWSPCINGKQMSFPIKDLNSCGSMDNASILTRPCEDEDDGESDDSTTCTEDWDCAEWSDCIQGYRVRECIDRNACGTDLNKSSQMERCEQNEPPEACTEDWVCSEWSECMDNRQARVCEDVNGCGTADAKHDEDRSCVYVCVEDWVCSEWSECMDNLQARLCGDVNQCSAAYSATETRECDMPEEPPALPPYSPEPNATAPSGDNQTNATAPSEPNATAPSGDNQTNATAPDEKGENTTRVYDEIVPDEPAILIMDDTDVSINQITITVREQVSDVKITVKKIEDRPAHIPDIMETRTKRVYNYLEISKENLIDDNIDNATINFEVNKSWIREQGVNALTISFMRYDDGVWTVLPTTMVDEDADKFYFQAKSPGFSIFAIAGEYMLESTGVMCIPMDRRCFGDELQECDLDGLAWTIIEECEFGCRTGGTCNDALPEEMPAQAEDYVYILLVAILVVISLLTFVMMFFRLKRKRIADDIRGGIGPRV